MGAPRSEPFFGGEGGGDEAGLQQIESQFHVLDFARLGIDQTSFAWLNMLSQSVLETWEPVTENLTNLDAATIPSARYVDIGEVIFGWGRMSVNPTLTATSTSFDFDPPVSITISEGGQVGGVAFTGDVAGMGARIFGVTGTNKIRVQWISSDINAQPMSFIFIGAKG